MEIKKTNIADPWESLKSFTSARIALGRAGTGIPIDEYLKFKLAHAHARDAVFSLLDVKGLTEKLSALNIPVIDIQSKADSRAQYLQRPDLGRSLDENSRSIIMDNAGEYDVCIIVADGLCANAINENVVELVNGLITRLGEFSLRSSPVFIARQARVALSDEIGYLSGSGLSVILIGERPGLSSVDSIGAYITYKPQPGLTDESRNCVSNIRYGGLPLFIAIDKIFYLLQEAFKRKLSGVHLKDDSGLLDRSRG